MRQSQQCYIGCQNFLLQAHNFQPEKEARLKKVLGLLYDGNMTIMGRCDVTKVGCPKATRVKQNSGYTVIHPARQIFDFIIHQM
jgi:hypothetical protein